MSLSPKYRERGIIDGEIDRRRLTSGGGSPTEPSPRSDCQEHHGDEYDEHCGNSEGNGVDTERQEREGNAESARGAVVNKCSEWHEPEEIPWIEPL